MRLLMIALAALPLTAAAAEPVQQPDSQPLGFAAARPDVQCPKHLVEQVRPEAKMNKLAELPPADAFHAVYRLDGNGCVDPVMVGYQYGR